MGSASGKGVERAAFLDEFLRGLLESADPGRQSVLLTSDHGNLEDCSTRSHTRNPVPAFIWGPATKSLAGRMEAITDVTPAVLEWLERER